jgi:hypothetical protein
MRLAAEPLDMRSGADRLIAPMVEVFGAAQAHQGYLFANPPGTRMKLLGTMLWRVVRHAPTQPWALRMALSDSGNAAPHSRRHSSMRS